MAELFLPHCLMKYQPENQYFCTIIFEMRFCHKFNDLQTENNKSFSPRSIHFVETSADLHRGSAS